jgi:S1-C subfamily serine protease
LTLSKKPYKLFPNLTKVASSSAMAPLRNFKHCLILVASLVEAGHPFVVPHASASPHPRPPNPQNYAVKGDSIITDGSLSSLSVTELKKLLSERSVDFRDCLEKRDLIERLQKSQASRTREARIPATGLSDQEHSLINTFKRVSPSVANIKTTTLVPHQRGLQLQGLEVPQGSGSGFLWDSRGHIVTNFHVVSAGRRDGTLPSTVKVKLAGMAQALDADIVGVEPEKDLAVLKIRNLRNLPHPIDVGTSNDLQVGQSVMAIGNPFGLDDTLTTGIVSALGRDVDGIGGRPIHGCIQTGTYDFQAIDIQINAYIFYRIFRLAHRDFAF